MPKIALFCFPETKSFPPSCYLGAVMTEFGEMTGCRERMTPVSPISPILPFIFSENLNRDLWTPSGNPLVGAVMHLRACLKIIRGAVFGQKAGWRGAMK